MLRVHSLTGYGDNSLADEEEAETAASITLSQYYQAAGVAMEDDMGHSLNPRDFMAYAGTVSYMHGPYFRSLGVTNVMLMLLLYFLLLLCLFMVHDIDRRRS